MATVASTEAPDVVIRSIFAKYDTDGSKAISAGELGRLLYDLGYHVPRDRLPDILAEINVDGKGAVDVADFIRWWRQSGKFRHLGGDALNRLTQAAAYFKYFDRDLTGSLSTGEFQALFADLQKNALVAQGASVADTLRVLDADKSGTVSFNEFMLWMDNSCK
jgi:Ca2+-binding EF-hand superfamily protein